MWQGYAKGRRDFLYICDMPSRTLNGKLFVYCERFSLIAYNPRKTIVHLYQYSKSSTSYTTQYFISFRIMDTVSARTILLGLITHLIGKNRRTFVGAHLYRLSCFICRYYLVQLPDATLPPQKSEQKCCATALLKTSVHLLKLSCSSGAGDKMCR